MDPSSGGSIGRSHGRVHGAPMRHDPGLSTAVVVAGSAFVCGMLLAVETLPRLVVDRRQPFHSPDLLAADDAVRS